MTAATAEHSDWALDMPMTDEHVFDLKGWLLILGVLTDEEREPVREHCIRLKEESPDNNYMPGRLAMPSQALLDHPAVVGVLREIIAPDRSQVVGNRCESTVPRCAPPISKG